MHTFLRAIGFSKYKTRRHLEPVYKTCLREPSRKCITTVSVDTSLMQFEKDFCQNAGVALIGEVDSGGGCSIEHYFPYLKGEHFMHYESIAIEKQADKESYAGVCEDFTLGMTIIFYISNIADYAKSKWLNYSNRNFTDVKFSGLCVEGTILLGIDRTRRQVLRERRRIEERRQLIEEALSGDEDALENLNMNEYDTYSTLATRVETEDILSIVETSFMPCGVECDHYLVVGNILKVQEETNVYTEEKLYNLLIEANNIILNVGINQMDLSGEPAVGRRFRGEIWLQGFVRI